MKRPITFACVVLALVLLTVVLLAWAPAAIVHLTPGLSELSVENELEAVDKARNALLQCLGGALLVWGAVVSWRQLSVSRQQALIAQQAQTATAFSSAVTNLQGPSVATQLAGLTPLRYSPMPSSMTDAAPCRCCPPMPEPARLTILSKRELPQCLRLRRLPSRARRLTSKRRLSGAPP